MIEGCVLPYFLLEGLHSLPSAPLDIYISLSAALATTRRRITIVCSSAR